MKTKRCNFVFEESLIKKAIRKAKDQGRSLTKYVEQLIKKDLKNEV